MRELLAIAASLSLLTSGEPLEAQRRCPAGCADSEQGPMRFSVRERPGQPPLLIAEGVIDQDTIPRLQAALERFRGREIWLRSAGGAAGIDHRAGMMIRRHGLNTRIPAGWTCRGGCAFMFLGGLQRTVEPGGLFAVDMFELGGDRSNLAEVERRSRMLATEDYDYLIRMGISPRLLGDIMYREPAREPGLPMRCLSRAELEEYRIITAPVRGSN